MPEPAQSTAPKMGAWNVHDTPPDISGTWERVEREMYERNPGDGLRKGIVKVDPPDPRAPGGRIVMKIEQQNGGLTYTSGDLIRAAHDHNTKGFYAGNKQFSYQTERVADADKSRMVLNGTLTLLPNGRLETMVHSAIGGNPVPHPDRDPPPGFKERSEWQRVSRPTLTPG